jgi:hypothetical protein
MQQYDSLSPRNQGLHYCPNYFFPPEWQNFNTAFRADSATAFAKSGTTNSLALPLATRAAQTGAGDA